MQYPSSASCYNNGNNKISELGCYKLGVLPMQLTDKVLNNQLISQRSM